GDLPAEQFGAGGTLDLGLDGVALLAAARTLRGTETIELRSCAPMADQRARGRGNLIRIKHRCRLPSSDDNFGLASKPPQQMHHRRLCHRHAAGGRPEIFARQMQKHRAAAASDAWPGVVVDLDDEIIKMVLARQPVSGFLAGEPDRPVIMAIARVFAPGVLGPDRMNGQMRPRPRMAVGPPPQFSGVKHTPRRAAVALALVSEDATAPECDRNGHAISRKPALPGISGPPPNPDHGKRPLARLVSY